MSTFALCYDERFCILSTAQLFEARAPGVHFNAPLYDGGSKALLLWISSLLWACCIFNAAITPSRTARKTSWGYALITASSVSIHARINHWNPIFIANKALKSLSSARWPSTSSIVLTKTLLLSHWYQLHRNTKLTVFVTLATTTGREACHSCMSL